MKAVNLIPSGQRATGGKTPAASAASAPGDSPVGAYAILAALVFAIAASAMFVMTKNDITDKKSELIRVQRQAETVKAQASALQSFADFKQLADARVETVRGLATSRFAWPATLDDVSRALPEDVYISSLDGTTLTSAVAGGASTSGLRGAIQAPSIQLNGCTKSQASVARLMSQLREIRGVTRVTLAKSQKTETAASAVAPAPATGPASEASSVTTEPCPQGAPPAFDMIVFFEHAAVNPNAAPNASATGTTVGPTGAAGAQTGPTGSSGSTSSSTSTTTTP